MRLQLKNILELLLYIQGRFDIYFMTAHSTTFSIAQLRLLYWKVITETTHSI
jgi:hypothetical protein